MESLNSDFELDRYGLHARLVIEDDAEFIVNIRHQTRVKDFLHQTSSDIEMQKRWIREYKKREANGEEYYFIFFKNNIPVGVGRTMSFNEIYCNSGSWVCSPSADLESVIATNLITNDVVFEILKKKVCLFEVAKSNKSVWRFHENKGAKRYYESDTHYFYTLTYEDYSPKRDIILNLLKF